MESCGRRWRWQISPVCLECREIKSTLHIFPHVYFYSTVFPASHSLHCIPLMSEYCLFHISLASYGHGQDRILARLIDVQTKLKTFLQPQHQWRRESFLFKSLECAFMSTPLCIRHNCNDMHSLMVAGSFLVCPSCFMYDSLAVAS